jgi:hypothetical protein
MSHPHLTQTPAEKYADAFPLLLRSIMLTYNFVKQYGLLSESAFHSYKQCLYRGELIGRKHVDLN